MKYYVDYDEEDQVWDVFQEEPKWALYDSYIVSFKHKEQADAVAKALNEVDIAYQL